MLNRAFGYWRNRVEMLLVCHEHDPIADDSDGGTGALTAR
jgi:hypothetical protein